MARRSPRSNFSKNRNTSRYASEVDPAPNTERPALKVTVRVS
jgi:hypothetical protein